MSKRLNTIPTSCPIYDKLVLEIQEIKNILGDSVFSLIKSEIDNIQGFADQIRDIAGDLRDTCSDILDEKNKEIEELQEELNGYNQ